MRSSVFFLQAEDGIGFLTVTGVQTCALPISGVDQRVGGGDPLRQLEAVAPVGQHGDVGGGARRALPADQQQVVRSSEARESLQKQRQGFFAGGGAGGKKNPGGGTRERPPRARKGTD